ncbi:MAG: hypothetical protein LW629_05625 [Burkholderiales bacterium]|nr:hypothetical protein [Burkholderiales bacterium]
MTKTSIKKNARVVTLALLAGSTFARPGYAQTTPGHAQGLLETLISVELPEGKKQVGVLSLKTGSDQPTKLAVLLPGSPSVVRPIVEGNVMTSAELAGNFLIRARRFLVDESIATLIVECQSGISDHCDADYQASAGRQQDVGKLIADVRKKLPSVDQVWLVGTSMGTISSSFMLKYAPSAYAGAIHTAAITEPYAKNSYRELGGFDYKKAGRPQFLIHHKEDPCSLTTYSGAKTISEKYELPLITVLGGSGFNGPACKAHTAHGFKGKEKEVMTAIAQIIKTGTANQLEIQ